MTCETEYNILIDASLAMKKAAEIQFEKTSRLSDELEATRDLLFAAGIGGAVFGKNPAAVLAALAAAGFTKIRPLWNAAKEAAEAESHADSAYAAYRAAAKNYGDCVERHYRVPGGPIPK
ncbi:MAG: hypothetical protein A3F17_06660 [Gammaproteobacteria bacterium RIFCSPHIGHO2_12_FULL_41_15]|nr:MAG: hypothetical protein A3F17_06660 [Gammaproteobacteria bacterium RIFCSPHIGHO2_12_FULL_41_15]